MSHAIDLPLLTDPRLRAEMLGEAITYVRRFQGKRVVVKVGGSMLTESAAADDFMADVFMLHSLGIQPVVVHGGGPQITEWMSRIGLETTFNNGHRVTDAATLDLVRMVLVGKINREIVAGINHYGSLALGLSGEDGGLLTVVPRHPDLGFVGDVTKVNTSLIDKLLAESLIPVVATIGVDVEGQAYNVNADLGAAAIAVAVGALKLIYLTDVDGVMADVSDPDTLIREIGEADLEVLLAGGTLGRGMIPKVEGCLQALEGGVETAHVLNGDIPHALLVELLTDRGVGTMVTKEAT